MARNLGAIIIDRIRSAFIKDTFNKLPNQESLLDLGCGIKPYSSIYNKKVDKSVGVEVKTSLHDQSHVDFFYDGENLPFSEAEFDIVLSTEVMEHVKDSDKYLNEIHRVLKPNGTLVLTIPFFVPLHEKPFDFYRFTEFGLKHLAKKHNYKVSEFQVFGDYFGVIISLLIIPQLKVWTFISKKLRISFIGKIYNPFVFLFIYLPQVLYLNLRKIKMVEKALKKWEYVPKGYGIVLTKVDK